MAQGYGKEADEYMTQGQWKNTLSVVKDAWDKTYTCEYGKKPGHEKEFENNRKS